VRTGVNSDQVFIQFTDSGPGVQDASRVFDPFYTTKPVGKGTGLGLSICYGIITEHGGTIRVKNQPTKGASFTIELPFPASTRFLQTKVAGTVSSHREGKILLVASDESVLETVGAMLRSAQHEVFFARSVEDFSALFDENQVDLVIAENSLSEVLAAKSNSTRLGPTAFADRLIVMTDSTSAAKNPDFPAPNAGCILQKPIQSAELISAVDELLSRVHAAVVER